MEVKRKRVDYVPEEISYLRRGIDFQREYYKRANLENNYEVMVKALENIKSEIKHKALARGKKAEILKVHRILDWYKQLPQAYAKRTQSGTIIRYPPDIEQKISKNLHIAYETLIELLGVLGLI